MPASNKYPASRPSEQNRRLAGFNLIELLVAIAVLIIIITMMASIYRESDAAWNRGVGLADTEASAQRAMQFISQDIRSAIVDPNLTFVIRRDRKSIQTYGIFCAELNLITLAGSQDSTNRAARAVMYWVRQTAGTPGCFELVRASRPATSATNDCYHNPTWFEDSSGHGRPTAESEIGVVAQNITGFGLFAKDVTQDITNTFSSVDNINILPSSIDIYIELLSPRDARRAATLTNNMDAAVAFVEKNARCHAITVYPSNRTGYAPR